MAKKCYKQLDVWVKKDERTIIRYRCFQALPDSGYCVQSADYYNYPFSEIEAFRLDRQFLELLAEEYPDLRSPTFPTVEEAISAFILEFEPDGPLQ